MRQLIFIFSILIVVLAFDFTYGKLKGGYDYGVMTKGCILENLVTGYDIKAKAKCRFKRVVKGHTEWDEVYATNNLGYVSPRNYQEEKVKGRKRGIVLGLSTSAAKFLKESWPNHLDRLLDDEIEMYNFSQAGFFTLNYFNLYFNRIINFDYDVLFLPFPGVGNKQFMIFLEEGSRSRSGLYSNIPESKEDFEKNYRRRLFDLYFYFDSRSLFGDFGVNFPLLDKNIKMFKKHWRKLSSISKGELKKRSYQLYNKKIDVSAPTKDFFTSRNIDIYLQIIQHALDHDRKVVFYQAPVKSNIRSEMNPLKAQFIYDLKKISKNIYFFNGNDFYMENSELDKRSHFFKYDGHWNQLGSDIFAKNILDWIRDNKIF